MSRAFATMKAFVLVRGSTRHPDLATEQSWQGRNLRRDLTLLMSMNCLDPTLSACTMKARSYSSSMAHSLASYCNGNRVMRAAMHVMVDFLCSHPWYYSRKSTVQQNFQKWRSLPSLKVDLNSTLHLAFNSRLDLDLNLKLNVILEHDMSTLTWYRHWTCMPHFKPNLSWHCKITTEVGNIYIKVWTSWTWT